MSYLVVELDQNSGVGPCRTLLIQNAYLNSRCNGQQGVTGKISHNTWWVCPRDSYSTNRNNRGRQELDGVRYSASVPKD